MKTSSQSVANRILLLAVVASLPMVFGFKGCLGSGGTGSVGSAPSGLVPCPPNGTTPNPPGGFCAATEDENSNGVFVPHLNAKITGHWVGDLVTPAPVGTIESFSFATPPAWPQYVSGGRQNAQWDGTVQWANESWCPGDDSLQQWSGQGADGSITSNSLTWPIFTCQNFTSTQEFFLVGTLPSTITVQASGLTTANGAPQLQVFSGKIGGILTLYATSTASNGSSATFVFPTYQGSPLPAGQYPFSVSNQTTSGVFENNAVGFFSIGTPVTTYTTPFGIDVGDYSSETSRCTLPGEVLRVSPDFQPPPPPKCSTSGSSTPAPVPAVTSFSNGTMTYGSRAFTVGSQPTTVKLFDNQTVTNTQVSGDFVTTTTTTGPLYGLTTNFGSNTVSVVTLASGSVSSIPVGSEPMTAVLDPTQANAYVANYGSASVSQINLTSFAQARLVSVGPSPSALAMDPSGTALWVGGLNYIEEISLSTYAPIHTFTVSGEVTSLAISQGENAIVYSTVASSSGLYMAQNANVVTGATVATYENIGTISSDYTKAYAVSAQSKLVSSAGNLPLYLVSGGAMVSTVYGNRYAVMATPTGFDLYDLQTNTVMFSAATAGPVRGIAVDPGFAMAYLTIADTNTVLEVPLPPTQ